MFRFLRKALELPETRGRGLDDPGTTDIRLDDELEDARWFRRRDIPALLDSGELALPAPETISRNLFDAWYAGETGR